MLSSKYPSQWSVLKGDNANAELGLQLVQRLTVRTDGKIQYELKNPFRHGTTHFFRLWIFLASLQASYPDRATISSGIMTASDHPLSITQNF